ncbi:MAG: histidine triad nucleotide-binding protein [Dehalococcoidia bacterium]|nr:histidine triad nucleotide-binding protein [Dehalococcoidia bacterium]
MTEESCIFCRIIARDIPAQIVDESDEWLAFRDIHPVAPIHVLVVPKKHLGSVEDLTTEDVGMVGRLIMVAKQIARTEGISESGYRILVNSGRDAGQLVRHLHFHLIGGRKMGPKVG